MFVFFCDFEGLGDLSGLSGVGDFLTRPPGSGVGDFLTRVGSGVGDLRVLPDSGLTVLARGLGGLIFREDGGRPRLVPGPAPPPPGGGWPCQCLVDSLAP